MNSFSVRLVCLASVVAMSACGGKKKRNNAEPDSGPVTIDTGNNGTDNNGTNNPPDMGNNGGMTNNGVDPDDPFAGVAPMTVVKEGTTGLLLHGTVLTPFGFSEGAHVLVLRRDIVCVGVCTDDPAAKDATWVATGGIISPGLIDSHNHVTYNFLPEWKPPGGQLFENRYQWSDDPSYEAHIEPFAAHRSSGSHFCPAARWGELRSLVHGTTTIMGQSQLQNCIKGGARNADHEHRLKHDHMRTTISSPRDVTDEQAENFLDSIYQEDEPTERIAVHMAEGYAENNVLLEFGSWAGRDERDNRHRGISLLVEGTSLLIHGVGLTSSELDEVAATNSKMVWSPSSNIALYGRTADIAGILDRGITVGLGPDWTVSGEDDMLAELRFARAWAVQNGVAELTHERLWRMATEEGAVVVGLDGYVGKIEVGYRADLAVFSKLRPDPYESVAANGGADVQLVMVDGEAYYGPAALEDTLARGSECEPFDACGVPKFICAANWDTSGAFGDYQELRQDLIDILEGNGYPPEEQYGRGDELLPLINCP